MEHKFFFNLFKFSIFVFLVGGLALSFSFLGGKDDRGNTIPLQVPVFINEVKAAPVNELEAFLDEEAGIAAYAQTSDTPINFSHIKSAFRTIEVETNDYLIGSVPVSGYSESDDVHVYVNTDGWLLGYYPSASPASKIIDWKSYDGSVIPVKVEKALDSVANQGQFTFADVKYYDFRYPNATTMMMVSKQRGTFQVTLPENFEYYEASWSLGYYAGLVETVKYILDGEVIKERTNYGWNLFYGSLSMDQLLPELIHNIEINADIDKAYGGLVLIYRESQ